MEGLNKSTSLVTQTSLSLLNFLSEIYAGQKINREKSDFPLDFCLRLWYNGGTKQTNEQSKQYETVIKVLRYRYSYAGDLLNQYTEMLHGYDFNEKWPKIAKSHGFLRF